MLLAHFDVITLHYYFVNNHIMYVRFWRLRTLLVWLWKNRIIASAKSPVIRFTAFSQAHAKRA